MTPIESMRLSLDGLSVGDGFGERFFVRDAESLIAQRAEPRRPWEWTDDTAMAISIFELLRQEGRIDQDLLAKKFAKRWLFEPGRGYGGGALSLLERIQDGEPWCEVARSLFHGQGSLGNGGAMRVAPLGAFFAHEPVARIVEEARLSAEVTHAHPEGQAGAIAVALAAAFVARGGRDGLLAHAIEHTPEGDTRAGLRKAAELSPRVTVKQAAILLGSGSQVSAPDTVPFALWAASKHLGDFTEAMWATVEGLGDRDTTCAIVGGIVALAAEIPADWLAAREPLSV
ncbi:MAG: ADP-ribosylglycohydrolase family protein [Planctomycetota bacterium]